jgi:hypothetical protein
MTTVADPRSRNSLWCRLVLAVFTTVSTVSVPTANAAVPSAAKLSLVVVPEIAASTREIALAANDAEHIDGSGLPAITLSGPAFLSITDPLGRAIGYEAERDRYYSDASRIVVERGKAVSDPASAGAIRRPDRAVFQKAMDGRYTIEVIGLGQGSFEISIAGYDTAGDSTLWSGSGMTSRDSHVVYLADFSSKPGAPLDARKVAHGSGILQISLSGAAYLSVTDPVGRTIKYDVEGDRYIYGIPHCDEAVGLWSLSGGQAGFDIGDAIDGDYRIEVLGQGPGWFGLSIVAFDSKGDVNGGTGQSGPTTAGSRTVYIVEFSAKPGVPAQVREVTRGIGGLKIMLFGGATLSLTDPIGRAVRYDAGSRDYVSEIPLCTSARQTLGLGPRNQRGD